MNHLIKIHLRLLLVCACFIFSQSASAWDSVGHRLAVAVAMNYLSEPTKAELRSILQHHPRFQQDFLEQMPPSIARVNNEQQLSWLLGQAAFWPDIARRLPEQARQKYNHPNWHYIDGAWVRGKAATQGNSYIGVQDFNDIAGEQAGSIVDASQVSNIMTALDYNTALLADTETTAEQRALALCWVLHLVADIHQPLHAGSLYSVKLFKKGDRGGNGITTDAGNLHARWDRALRSEGINLNLQIILEQQTDSRETAALENDSDWSQWMNESRTLLLDSVYTPQMKSAIVAAEHSDSGLPRFTLDDRYIEQMQESARQRLALAGRRLAIWFRNNL